MFEIQKFRIDEYDVVEIIEENTFFCKAGNIKNLVLVLKSIGPF